MADIIAILSSIAVFVIAIWAWICDWSAGKYLAEGPRVGANESARPAVKLITEYKDINRRAVYSSHLSTDSINVHNGQLKLFLTELQFMTLCLKDHDAEGTFVYAGSAPSNKLSYLARLFPKVKFVLVDPHEHYIMFPKKDGSAAAEIVDDDHLDDEETTDDQEQSDQGQSKVHPADMYSDEHSREVLFFQASAGHPAGDMISPGMKARKRAHGKTLPKLLLYKPRELVPHAASADVLPPRILEPTLTPRQEHTMIGEIPDNIAEVINETSYRYYIIENLMTNDLADKLNKLRGPVYFISDIRTSVVNKSMPTDYDICMNSAMMYNWIARLKPTKYMLKFRCPWPTSPESKAAFADVRSDLGDEVFGDCPIDFRGNFAAGKFVYLRPEHIFVQAFAGSTSTETRLVGSGLDTVEYDMREYEEKFMWFNTVHRQRNRIIEAVENTGQQIKCYNNRQDCALAVAIFHDYLTKYSGGAVASATVDSGGAIDPAFTPQTAVEMLRELIKMIGRTLCMTKEHHEYKKVNNHGSSSKSIPGRYSPTNQP